MNILRSETTDSDEAHCGDHFPTPPKVIAVVVVEICSLERKGGRWLLQLQNGKLTDWPGSPWGFRAVVPRVKGILQRNPQLSTSQGISLSSRGSPSCHDGSGSLRTHLHGETALSPEGFTQQGQTVGSYLALSSLRRSFDGQPSYALKSTS